MAPHASTLAWKIPWTEEPGGLQSMGSLRVRHDCATSLSLFTFMHWRRKWQPTPVFLPGEQASSSPRWSLVGCRLWGCTEQDMADVTQQQKQQTGSLSFESIRHSDGTRVNNFYASLYAWVFVCVCVSAPSQTPWNAEFSRTIHQCNKELKVFQERRDQEPKSCSYKFKVKGSCLGRTE